MNVSCGTLRLAQGDGCASVEALARVTGASTLCGSCQPLLAELLGGSQVETVGKGSKALGVAAAAAALLILGILLSPAIPYASSVQTVPYDSLWRNGLFKQISGFTLLGVSLLGLLMSLRKRIRKFTFGEFGMWRALHGVMGAGGLLVLVAHTGMRFGSNLNFALMLFVVLSNLAGAIAGGTAARSQLNSTPDGMRIRRYLLWGHIALVWPLPVLAAFHILSVYYF
jgi:nitrite reductase (NADH) large subunit